MREHGSVEIPIRVTGVDKMRKHLEEAARSIKLLDRYGGTVLVPPVHRPTNFGIGATFIDKDGEWRIIHHDVMRHHFTIERDRRFFRGRYRVVTGEYIYRWRKFIWEMDQRGR